MSLTEASNYSSDFDVQPLQRKAGFNFYLLSWTLRNYSLTVNVVRDYHGTLYVRKFEIYYLGVQLYLVEEASM